jgi:hypothetical protein
VDVFMLGPLAACSSAPDRAAGTASLPPVAILEADVGDHVDLRAEGSHAHDVAMASTVDRRRKFVREMPRLPPGSIGMTMG